ncbi:hypothetical protein Cgig2_025099 [Carnegiea gigantea]|uniref:Uncharacterized protein n=1 Tax=Carnegiea gigantea TaxID=171969 RepID=A0A9Q1KIQ5_9CARY|nr:hypothetical protein Cgig2_025099 [Carnegiea gigantea]
MMQAIFYAMVIDDAPELGLSRRLTMDVVMWAMRKLDWGLLEAWLGNNDQRLLRAQASRPTDSPANLVLASSSSRGRMSSFPSFRDIVQAAEYIRDNLRWSKRETSSLPVFYAMVISDAARLRLIRRETGESLMSDLQKLRWDAIEAWLLFIEDKLKDARR